MSEARDLDYDDLPEDIEDERPEPADRKADLLGRKDSPIRREMEKLCETVRKGFEDQYDRANAQMDYWNAFNCVLDENQYYDGNAEIYVPIIHDAVNAYCTRVSNQLFPEGKHYVDVVTDDAADPLAIVALLDKYLAEGETKTNLCKPLLRNAMIEGQFNLYVDWLEIRRQIVSRETHGSVVRLGGEDVETPDEEIDDVSEEEILEARPIGEVLHDSDVLVLPQATDSIDEALAAGGCVAIVRRWSKAKLEALAKAGVLNKTETDTLIEEMDAQSEGRSTAPPDLEKQLLEQVGIRKKGSEATVHEVWKMLPLNDKGKYAKDGDKRICRMFLSINKQCLGCHRNPHWNDRVPLISRPIEKVAGMFKGKSQVEYVISLQYEANDAANEGADMSHMSACGLILRDPVRAGKQPLVMNIGAVWDVPPDSVSFQTFPDLTQRAMVRIQYCIGQIFQTLGVNPSMLPFNTSTSKRNQAQVAQEQQVDLLTTTEAASVLVEGVFTPFVSWCVDLDYQYRDIETTAMRYGQLGVKAVMQAIPPQLNRSSFQFKWTGVERARNVMAFQQKIGWMNVARGLQPILEGAGYRLNLASPMEESAIELWGPHIGPKVIEDLRSQLSADPNLENQLMEAGHEVPIHQLDEDQTHIPVHNQAAQRTGDPHGNIKLHIQYHLLSAAQKQAKALAAQQQVGMQQQMQGGRPGGQPPRGGQPTRQGAMPQGPQLVKQAPGAIHPDQAARAGAAIMPRRF